MALLTRSRSRPDPVEQVVDQVRGRAREAREVAERAREASGPALERAREVSEPALERAREVSGPALDRAREVSGPALERAREVSEPALERAREASAPAFSQLVALLRRLLGLVARVASVLPGIASGLLAWLAGALGSLADSTAAVAEAERPSTVARRGRRRRAALWFTGGFAVGAAAGYAACELGHREPDDEWDEADGPTAVPDAPTRPATG